MPKLMDKIRKGRRIKPRKVLLYGVDGVGKTTWSSKAPSPIFIPTEDGLDDIDCESFPVCKNYSAVVECLNEIRHEDHDYKTLVIDSADWCEALINAHVVEQSGKDTIADIPFGKGYAAALAEWRHVLSHLDAILATRNMSIILLAHCQIVTFANPDGEAFDRYFPRLHQNSKGEGSSPVLREWADEVLFARYKVFTTKEDAGFGKKNVRAVGSGERVLMTSERPGWVAKNRIAGMPEEIPMTWDAYAQCLKESYAGLKSDNGEKPKKRGRKPKAKTNLSGIVDAADTAPIEAATVDLDAQADSVF